MGTHLSLALAIMVGIDVGSLQSAAARIWKNMGQSDRSSLYQGAIGAWIIMLAVWYIKAMGDGCFS